MSQAYISAKLQSKVYNVATKGQDSPLKWKLNDRYCSPPRYELLNFLSSNVPLIRRSLQADKHEKWARAPLSSV